METLGPGFAAAVRASDPGNQTSASVHPAREQLATTITSWRQHNWDDGIGFVRAAVGAMDDLDAVMPVNSVDTAIDKATCKACRNI